MLILLFNEEELKQRRSYPGLLALSEVLPAANVAVEVEQADSEQAYATATPSVQIGGGVPYPLRLPEPLPLPQRIVAHGASICEVGATQASASILLYVTGEETERKSAVSANAGITFPDGSIALGDALEIELEEIATASLLAA